MDKTCAQCGRELAQQGLAVPLCIACASQYLAWAQGRGAATESGAWWSAAPHRVEDWVARRIKRTGT